MQVPLRKFRVSAVYHPPCSLNQQHYPVNIGSYSLETLSIDIIIEYFAVNQLIFSKLSLGAFFTKR